MVIRVIPRPERFTTETSGVIKHLAHVLDIGRVPGVQAATPVLCGVVKHTVHVGHIADIPFLELTMLERLTAVETTL